MNILDEDLDDSALLCKTISQKRKALQNVNPKNSKQMKLVEIETSGIEKTVENGNKANVLVDDSDILLGNKTTSTKKNYNLEWNQSSSYFSGKKSASTCPLCLKSFKTDSAYSAHMKQCAKTHKMTTQQLLEALELQKKQMRERRALGLCSQSLPSPKKLSSKKKTLNKLESFDLALGLALSKSMIPNELNLSSTPEVQKVTLEEFGFTSRSTVSGTAGKKKNENEKKSALRERTAEERQRIIVEKVAVILLDEDQGMSVDNKKINENSSSQSIQAPQLWNLGENHEKCNWYVTGIKALVLSDEENAQEKNTASSVTVNIKKELSELNLPQKEFNEGWKKMINNCFKSDLIGRTKDKQDVFLHSLVLFARFPEVLEKDFESIFEKYNLSTVLVFLEYLYCGTLNSLIASEIDNLFDLSTEVSFNELILVLNCLKSKLKMGSDLVSLQTTTELENAEKEREKTTEKLEKPKFIEDRDLFSEDGMIDLTQESGSNESNVEKSYWSFMQHEKKGKNSEAEMENYGIGTEEETRDEQNTETLRLSNECKNRERNSKSTEEPEKINISDDSETRDLEENAKTSSDCIILSSGSEPPHSRTPSPVNVGEVPYFDPYDNFNFFSEEQFSPVGLNSQSLLGGDISVESMKLQSSAQESVKQLNDNLEEEPKKTVGYCSTPVTIRQTLKVKSSSKVSLETFRKGRRDPSASRILRKSLGLQQKMRTPKPNSRKKSLRGKRRGSSRGKDIVEALANSVLHELSKSFVFQKKNFVEITPISSREEFGESVTPSPNYSSMGESLLKEQLAKYGLKKNLARSKARKILRHIYEELHPLYNTETGKIIKMLPSNTPKEANRRKSKSKKAVTKIIKAKIGKNATKNVQKNDLNSSKESQDLSDQTIGPTDVESDGSEFSDLNETLTQSVPSNAVDLPSAFCEYLDNNPDYHQKILLYEPIWLEELQKSLKGTFKKHFKMSDLMDYLDQKCITFRSAAQSKKIQKRYKKKET